MLPQLIAQDTPATLTISLTDHDENPLPVEGVTVTVTGPDEDVAEGEATVEDGQARFDLDAQPAPTLLDVTWNTDEDVLRHSKAEIVGFHLFTVAQARSFDRGDLTEITDSVRDEDIRDERTRVTDQLEQACGQSWIPRYTRHTMSTPRAKAVALPDHQILEILAVTHNGEDVDDATHDAGWLSRPSGWSGQVTVDYIRGHDRIVDGVDRVALILTVHRLVPGQISSRALAITDEFGTTKLAVPGSRWPFGIPVVDQWIEDHNHKHRYR